MTTEDLIRKIFEEEIKPWVMSKINRECSEWNKAPLHTPLEVKLYANDMLFEGVKEEDNNLHMDGGYFVTERDIQSWRAL